MNTKRNLLNPFPGLRPFRQDEDYLFFGREDQTIELLRRLGDHRFVAVVGTSGSGKSSLVRCGLLSELLGGKLLRAGASWEVVVTHPGGNPLALLAEAFLEADLYDRESEDAREQLLATLGRSHFGLVEAVKHARLADNTNFLLVVDQFEEIFRFNEAGQTQQEVANEFVSILLEAVAQTEVPIYIVLTMRSDFIGDCGQFEGLAEMVNRGEFLIPRLSRDQYKRVIEAPIKVAGGRIAPRLLQRLLNDLGQQADQLPCLQHALMRTWSVWSERGDAEALDLEDYQRVGRMSQALSLHADEIFDSLENDRQRELCAGMFKALTVQESENRGIRRPQRLASLCQILEVSSTELCPIIEAFRQSHVTFLMPSSEVPLTDKTIIDISHESLMRVWTRLRRWVDEEAQAVGIYRRLSESAALHGQSKAGLYRDPELGIALAWREANRPNQAWAERYHPGFINAMEFLDASQQAHLAEDQEHEAARQRELEQARMLAAAERARAETETRSARRLRMLLAGTAVIAMVALGASLVAINFWRTADLARQTAELSEQSAKLNAQSAKSEAERATVQEAAAKAARRDSEENLARARGAIDDYLTKISESQLLGTPGLQPLRAQLLASASQFYEDILKKDPNNPDLQAGLAAAFFRVGFVRWDTGDLVQSEQALERAAQFYKSALTAQPANTELKHGLANCWFTLGAVYLNADSNRSNDYAKRAAQIWEELIQSGEKDLRFHKELARACNIIGINYSQTSKLEEAFLAYQRSLSIRLSLISEHPDDVQLIHGLAESFNNIAFQVNDPKLRVQMHLRGIDYAERAHQLRPQVVEYAADLSGFYSIAAVLLAARGRHGEAQEMVRRNLDHLAKFIRGNPSVPSVRQLLPRMIGFQLGQMVSGTGDAANYVQSIRDCANLSAALPKESPEDYLIDAETQSLGAAWLAFAWGQKSQRTLTPAEVTERDALRERGIEALRKAIAAGFKDVGRLEQDASLNDLRQHAKFPQLVAQLKGANSQVAGLAAQPAANRIASAAELAQFNQDRATGYLVFGILETSLSRTDQAAKSLDQALALRQTLAAAAPENKLLQADLAGVRDALAGLYWKTDRLAPARELFQKRIQELERQVQEKSADPAADTAEADAAQIATITDLVAVEREFADSLAEACLWEEAASQYAQSLNRSLILNASLRKKNPTNQVDVNAVYEEIVAPMLWLLESTDQSYPAACEQVLAKFSPSSYSEQAARAARLCALIPKAVADLTPVLALTEKVQNSWHAYTRGLVLYRAGRFDEAIRVIDAARQKNEIVGVGVEDFVLAMAHFQAGRKEQARTILAAANQKSPRIMGAWTHEPYNLLDVDWVVLRREANQLIHGSPYGLDDRRRRGQSYARLGDYVLAETELTAVIAELPDDPRSRLVLARVLWELGRQEQAAQALDQARQVLTAKWVASAGDVDLWRTCAETYRRFGRLDDVSESLRRAVAAQSLRVVKAPERNTERWLLVRLNNELIETLQAAGHEAEAASARQELESFHIAFGLPPILESVTDVVADSGQPNAAPVPTLAAIDRLITASQKSKVDNDPIRANLLGRLHQRRAEALQDGGRSETEIQDAIAAAREQYERLLVADPHDSAAAIGLAELMLSKSHVPWTTLEPITLNAKAGTTLTVQSDGSILASGVSPDQETYTVVATSARSGLTAVRLETLPHPSFSFGGSGRDRNGAFFLSEFTVALAQPGKPPAEDPLPIRLKNAAASTHRTLENGTQYPIELAIDGQPTAWDPWPGVFRRQQAVFELEPNPEKSIGSPLVIQLTTTAAAGRRATLGRFRLSVSEDPSAFAQEQQRFAALKIADPWVKLGMAYALNGQVAKGAEVIAVGLDQAADDAAKTQIIQSVAQHAEVLQEVIKLRPEEPLLQEELAKLLAARGENELAAVAGDKARTLFEQQLAQQPENVSLMHALADLILQQSARRKWMTLTPTELKSDGGEVLTVEKDGSIFVSGPNPERAAYTLKSPTDLPSLTAIRIETLPDPRLPLGGAGRFPGNGNFHLAELTAAIESGKSDAQPMPIDISSAMADDHGTPQHEPSKIFDGKPETYWDTYPRHLPSHWVVFGLRTPVRTDGGSVSITLDSGITSWGHHGLGHFRLSVTDAPNAYQREEQRLAALRLPDPWAQLGAAYALSGESDRAADLLAKSKEKEGIASWLESGFSIDGVVDSLQARHPETYSQMLPKWANAAAERGQTDQARSLYGRLVKLQPEKGLWKERMTQLQPGVLSVWNFDVDLGPWGAANHCELSIKEGILTAKTTGSDPFFLTPATGPAGEKAVVLRYRTDQAFTLQIFWADASGGLSDSRHLDYPVPASAGEWREITLPFSCQGALNTLRLDPNTTGEHPLEIDFVALRHLEPAEYLRHVTAIGIEPELARLTHGLEANPMSASVINARGTFLTQLGRWRESAEDYSRELKLTPQSRFPWVKVANCLILAGDEEKYREHCRAMVLQFRGTSEADIADSVCKTCLLRPGAIEFSELELPIQKLRDGATDPKWEKYRHWFNACCALISYREGKHEESIAWTKKDKSLAGHSGALALVVRAMAEQQLGQNDQARKTLAQAEALIPKELRTLGTADYKGLLPVPAANVAHDWLVPEILRREAQQLIAGDGKVTEKD